MGDYEHEVLIRSRPRRRFGDFAAVGKVTRRPQAAKSPCEERNRSIIAPSSGPSGHLPPEGKAFGEEGPSFGPLAKGAGRRGREEAAKYPALCIYYG